MAVTNYISHAHTGSHAKPKTRLTFIKDVAKTLQVGNNCTPKNSWTPDGLAQHDKLGKKLITKKLMDPRWPYKNEKDRNKRPAKLEGWAGRRSGNGEGNKKSDILDNPCDLYPQHASTQAPSCV